MTTIGKIGPEAKSAVTPILPLLKDSETSVRFAAVFAYGRIGPDSAFIVPDLLQVLEKDPSEDVRREVGRALIHIGATSAKIVIPAVIKALQTDKSENVCRQLALTIGKMGDIKSSMNELLEIIKNDKDRSVRLYLVRSIPAGLGTGGLKDYVKEYAAWLGKEPESDVRLAIIQEIGALGPAGKEGLAALNLAESDVVLQVREAAKEAVLQVKDWQRRM